MNDAAVLRAVLRTDFYSFLQRVFREVAAGEAFVPNWHLEAMAHVATLIGSKQRRRQIIEVPPRSLKSICASVALVAWILGHDPTRKIICISYSGTLSTSLSAGCRQVMKSLWYRELFPKTVISSQKDTETYFRTTAGGYRDATSIGGTLTGKGADLIIIDDPAKPDEILSEVQRTNINNWFDRTLLTRLNNKATDGILLVMQRLHADDLAGHVRKQEAWHALTIPAIAEADEDVPLAAGRWHRRMRGDLLDPVREPLDVLLGLKAAMGSFAFSAQYQQEPLPPDGSIVEWAWFRRFEHAPRGARIVQSWDCASKNTEYADYSVCTTWGVVGADYYLLDITRRKMNFPELVQSSINLAERWSPTEILVEDAAAGIQLIQWLRLNRPCRMPAPLQIAAERDKITRLHGVSALIEQGRVYLPTEAPWLDEFQAEMAQFPYGKHDDQVDSLSQFLGREARRALTRGRIERRSMFGFSE